MKFRKAKNAGLKPRIDIKNREFDIQDIERFYYSVIVSILLFCKSRGDHKKEKTLDINLHLLKWIESSEKSNVWSATVKNELLWIKRNILRNPLDSRTLDILFNIHKNIKKVHTTMM